MLEPSVASWSPPKGVVIPNLTISVLQDKTFLPMEANTPVSIPFHTELFEGHVLLLVNTKPICDLYLPRFKGQKYQFEMQVQGKFRKLPEGRLFMGAEISKKMDLGLFTRGLCGTILQVARTVNPYIHSSYGDSQDRELPHIMGPLWSALDRY
jgi:hypothetical protein